MRIPVTAVSAAVVLTLLLAVLTPFIISKTVTWPHSYYLLTSEWKFGQPESPWAYRLAKPVLAGLLGGDNRYSFVVLTYMALVAAQIGLYVLLIEFGLSRGYAMLGMSVFAFSYPFRKALMYPWMLDDWNQMFLIWGLILIHRRQWGYFAVWLALACSNHEHTLFLVPILLFDQWPAIAGGREIKPLAALVPAGIVFLVIRKVVPIPNKAFFSYYFSPVNITSCYNLQGGILNIINLVYGTFSIFWLLALFGLWRLPLSRIEKAALVVIPLSFLQLIVGCDTSRLVAVNFALIALIGFRFLQQIHRGWTVFAVAVFFLRSTARFGGISMFHPHWILMIPSQVFTIVEFLAVLILFLSCRSPGRAGNSAGIASPESPVC